MRPVMLSLIVGLLCLGSRLAPAWADGGTVRLVERHGNRQISVFTSPNPLRAGPVDISVFVQDLATGAPIDDARTTVTLTASGQAEATIHAVASTEAATNKLLQSALVELPAAGTWNVQVRSTSADNEVLVSFTMTAGPALPRWLSQWVWFSWPAVAVLLFGVHRYLAARAHGGRSMARSHSSTAR